MRLSRPIYSGLQACQGRSDEEIERLTRLVYRRKPSLVVFPIVAFVLLLASIWMPRQLSEWTGMSMVWSLTFTAAALGVPIIVYEQRVHRPEGNREMLRVLAEAGASPNGYPVEPQSNSAVGSGPPSAPDLRAGRPDTCAVRGCMGWRES